MLPSPDHASSKRRRKNQSNKHYKQPEAYFTNKQHEKPLEQYNACIVPRKGTCAEETKFGKKICITGDSHLNRIKWNIFPKSVHGRKTYFNVFRDAKRD